MANGYGRGYMVEIVPPEPVSRHEPTGDLHRGSGIIVSREPRPACPDAAVIRITISIKDGRIDRETHPDAIVAIPLGDRVEWTCDRPFTVGNFRRACDIDESCRSEFVEHPFGETNELYDTPCLELSRLRPAGYVFDAGRFAYHGDGEGCSQATDDCETYLRLMECSCHVWKVTYVVWTEEHGFDVWDPHVIGHGGRG